MSGQADKRPDDGRYKAGAAATAAERAAIVAAVEQQARALELADPDAGLGRTGRMVNNCVEFVGVAALATVTTLIFINATLRYGFSTSLIWADELVISLIPLVAFCGLILSLRRGRMIRIDTFILKLPARTRHWVAIGGSLLSALAFAYLCYFSITYLQLFGNDSMVYFDMPKGLLQSVMVIGSFIASLTFLVQAWQGIRAR